MNEIFRISVDQSLFSENSIKTLLQTLAAKAGLDFDEIVDAANDIRMGVVIDVDTMLKNTELISNIILSPVYEFDDNLKELLPKFNRRVDIGTANEHYAVGHHVGRGHGNHGLSLVGLVGDIDVDPDVLGAVDGLAELALDAEAAGVADGDVVG